MIKKITILFFFVSLSTLSLFTREAKAIEYTTADYGITKHIDIDTYETSDIDKQSILLTDENAKLKIEITNMVSVIRTYTIETGYVYSEASSIYNDINVNIFGDEPFDQHYNMGSGTSSLTAEVTINEHSSNYIIISSGSYNFDNHYSISSFSFDIKITKTDIPDDNDFDDNDFWDDDFDDDNDFDDDDFDDDDDIFKPEKTFGRIHEQFDAYPNKCKISFNVKYEYGVKKVRLYRKDSKKGKYKLIKTMCDGSNLFVGTITDKGLKPNKQYWYKIKTFGFTSTKWSPYSKAKSYWTSTKKVKGKKRYKNTLKWKKVKGASGYVVTEEYKKFVGYNIFGQKLYDYYLKSYFETGTKHKIINNKKLVGIYVTAYSKHNGKYYLCGDVIYNKKKQMKMDTFLYRLRS